MPQWPLVIDGPYPARHNMARDRQLFAALRREDMPGFLRIYGWDEPALTIGYHQRQFRPHDPALNLPILPRPTGGGAVLHGQDITFSLAAPLEGAFSGSIPETYATLARIFAQALNTCGVPAHLDAGAPGFSPVCFERCAALELTLAGRKLMGAAQLRQGGFFLQQGVLPLRIDAALYARVFGPPAALPAAVSDACEGFSTTDFIRALQEAFAHCLNIQFRIDTPA